MQSIGGIVTNSLEDTTDDFISTILFSEMRKLTDPLLNKGGDLTLIEEAKNNLITQLGFGLTLYAYQGTMLLIQKLAVRSVAMWTYIASGKIKKGLDKIKSKNIKGKKALNILGSVVGTDKTAERIEVVKIINSNLDQIDQQIQNEKVNRISIEKKMLSIGATSAQIKGISSQEDFNLYLYKTKSSTWNDTQKDKKLFEKITGQKITESGSATWATLKDKLNEFSEFATDTEGKIFNLTEAILKIVNRTNIAK